MSTVEMLREIEAKATPGPWENGQHPAMKHGGIIKPVTFGGRVLVLPECEGGHVVLRAEDAALIAAMRNVLPALLRVADAAKDRFEVWTPETYQELKEALEALEEANNG